MSAAEVRTGSIETILSCAGDLDLLDVHGLVLTADGDPSLVLPHPGIACRSFVLAPIAEIAPEWRHPVSGETARRSAVSRTASARPNSRAARA